MEDRIVLDSSLAKLKSIEREVIEYFFFRDFSQTEIARRLGVSCNYVSHLVRAALRKLRSSLAREEQREASGNGEQSRLGVDHGVRHHAPHPRRRGRQVIHPLKPSNQN